MIAAHKCNLPADAEFGENIYGPTCITAYLKNSGKLEKTQFYRQYSNGAITLSPCTSEIPNPYSPRSPSPCALGQIQAEAALELGVICLNGVIQRGFRCVPIVEQLQHTSKREQAVVGTQVFGCGQ